MRHEYDHDFQSFFVDDETEHAFWLFKVETNFIDLLVPNTFYLSLNSAICNNERSYILTYSPNTKLILKQLSNLEAMLQVMNN